MCLEPMEKRTSSSSSSKPPSCLAHTKPRRARCCDCCACCARCCSEAPLVSGPTTRVEGCRKKACAVPAAMAKASAAATTMVAAAALAVPAAPAAVADPRPAMGRCALGLLGSWTGSPTCESPEREQSERARGLLAACCLVSSVARGVPVIRLWEVGSVRVSLMNHPSIQTASPHARPVPSISRWGKNKGVSDIGVECTRLHDAGSCCGRLGT